MQSMTERRRESYIKSLKAGKSFIYGLADPRTGLIFYVGQSRRPMYRLSNHLSEAQHFSGYANYYTAKRIRIIEIVSLGLRPVVKILEEVPLGSSTEREIFWIELLRSQGVEILNEEKPKKPVIYLGVE